MVFKVSVMTEQVSKLVLNNRKVLERIINFVHKSGKTKNGSGNLLKHGFHGTFEQNIDTPTRFPINFERNPHL